MRKTFQFALAGAAGFLALTAFHLLLAKGSTSTVPATADFRDAAATSTSPSDKIRSDGQGLYQNGIDCVSSKVYSSGMYFLRTVSQYCTTTTPRSIVLDFSAPVSPISNCTVSDPNDTSGKTLNICGANSVPDTRLIADYMFSATALTHGASVSLAFSLQRDFRGTDFTLDFEQPLTVTGTSGLRTAEAGAGAIAELYESVPSSNGSSGTKVSLGRFYMPFQVTVGE